MPSKLNRRDFVRTAIGGVGAAAVATKLTTDDSTSGAASPEVEEPTLAGATQAAPDADRPGEARPTETDSEAIEKRSVELARILAPIGVGTVVEGAEVQQVFVDEYGMGAIQLRSASGQPFRIDVCSREASWRSSRPVAETSHYAVYVANGGKGNTQTDEPMGLCAMRIGAAIKANESDGERCALIRKTDFWFANS